MPTRMSQAIRKTIDWIEETSQASLRVLNPAWLSLYPDNNTGASSQTVSPFHFDISICSQAVVQDNLTLEHAWIGLFIANLITIVITLPLYL